MPKFVVLKHETPAMAPRPSHYDFMVEFEGGQLLRTWALAEEPTPDHDIAAEPLEDHRPAYLEYEGPISNNRGHVTRWDRGECTIEEATRDSLRATVRGEKLIGTIEIKPDHQGTSIFRWHSLPPGP